MKSEIEHYEKRSGGTGTMHIERLLQPEEMGEHVTMYAKVTIDVNSSLGVHLSLIHILDNAWKWFINKPYIHCVEALGWTIYPICSTSCLSAALTVCDALLLPGGYDISGYYLKEARNEHCTTYEQPMDHLEFQVIDAFMKHEKPILGICRGMQTLNVYAKGSLLQHIDTQTHAPQHRHMVHSSSRSMLKQLYPHSFSVNSYHHPVSYTHLFCLP